MVGLSKIKVPLKKSELSLEKIVEYLPTIMTGVDVNNLKIRHEYDVYKGEHAILGKERPYSDDIINNKVVDQYIWTMVNFKCGYIYGTPLEFAEKGTEKHDEMARYNDYLTAINFRGIIDNVAEWVYATGVGYMFIEPRMPDEFNQSPFKVLHLESDRCAKVYSSYLDEEPLFDLVITPIDKIINGIIVNDYYILSVYTNDYYYEFEYQISLAALTSQMPTIAIARTFYKVLPLIEFYAYRDKIGIAESCELLQNALDAIDSNSIDNIQEFVNQLLVIKNTILGKTDDEKAETLRAAKRNGVLELFDQSKELPAEVKTLTLQLNNADVNVLKGQIKADMFSAWGVPLASSAISSGNVTQGGAEAANGWEHAYSVALKENNNMLTAFISFVVISLWICKNSSQSGIFTLNLNDIDIKYNIARSNNLQVKTQAFTYLVEHNVPADIAWATCELSGDAIAIGKRIDEQAEKAKQENIDSNIEKITDSEVEKTQDDNDSEVEKTQKTIAVKQIKNAKE